MNTLRTSSVNICQKTIERVRLPITRHVTSRRPSSSSSPRTASQPSTSSFDPPSTSSPQGYYKITLLRSAISLGDRKKGTLESLGIHRRMQTVYHPHSPEFAGKILAVKELVKVENVGKEEVRTKTEQRRERRPVRGFKVVGGLSERNLDAGRE